MASKTLKNFCAGAFCIVTGTLSANGPVSWHTTALPAEAGRVALVVTAICDTGWHIYALQLEREDGPIPTSVEFHPSPKFTITDSLQAPAPDLAYDPNFAMELGTYSDSVSFTTTIHRISSASFIVEGDVEYMSCNDKTCLPPKTVPFTIEVPAYHP